MQCDPRMNATYNASLLQENVSESISDIYWNQAKNLTFSIIMPQFAEQSLPRTSFDSSTLILKCPAQSPDLNTLENVWLFSKNHLSNNARCPPLNKGNFILRVDEVWSRIPQDCIHQLNTPFQEGSNID